MNKTKKHYKIKLYKSIFQIQYKKSLNFFAQLSKVCESFSDSENWEYNNISLISRDKIKNFNLHFASESSSYTQDSPDEKLESKMIERLIDEVNSNLNIQNFIRVGHRRIYLAEVGFAFNDLVQIVNLKLFNQESNFISASLGEVVDIRYVSIFKNEEYTYNINIGPVQNNEISFQLGTDRNNFTTNEDFLAWEKKYPKVAVFIDVDCFILKDCTSQNTKNIFDYTSQKSKEIADNFLKTILDDSI